MIKKIKCKWGSCKPFFFHPACFYLKQRFSFIDARANKLEVCFMTHILHWCIDLHYYPFPVFLILLTTHTQTRTQTHIHSRVRTHDAYFMFYLMSVDWLYLYACQCVHKFTESCKPECVCSNKPSTCLDVSRGTLHPTHCSLCTKLERIAPPPPSSCGCRGLLRRLMDAALWCCLQHFVAAVAGKDCEWCDTGRTQVSNKKPETAHVPSSAKHAGGGGWTRKFKHIDLLISSQRCLVRTNGFEISAKFSVCTQQTRGNLYFARNMAFVVENEKLWRPV